MPTLTVQHVEATHPPRFRILDDRGQATESVEVPPAAGFPVEGRPNHDLMSELRWYLEDFLDYPYDPETEHAERVLDALGSWAMKAFEALFGRGEGSEVMESAKGNGPLRLRIESADPRVLSWPWEAIIRPKSGSDAQDPQVERSLSGLAETASNGPDLPKDRINILMVTARPYPKDVAYRSMSRPLVDMVARANLPVDVHILRPPTFEQLETHLEARPNHYHILHFDGHGAYRPSAMLTGGQAFSAHQLRTLDAHRLKGYMGCLVFEDEIGGDQPVGANDLSKLIRRHPIPVVVLNACQSGMLDGAAETAFASVAVSLLGAGTRSVVAMAYSLYVSAAQEFLPDFYRGFFASGDVASGVREGRRRLFEQRGRVCARGRFDLEDWIVPVLYQRSDMNLDFRAPAHKDARNEAQPAETSREELPDARAFIGRDGAILQLERALRVKAGGILIHGLGGVGKTTLARGFLEWLAQTGGLKGGAAFWFTFQEIRSAEHLWNSLGEELVGPQIRLLEDRLKIPLLAKMLYLRRCIIVWDNFEVVHGSIEVGVTPTLSEGDRAQLRGFLAALRGGATKVLITSRDEEKWLAPECWLVPLGGLEGEERWAYCDLIVEESHLTIEREDPDVMELIDILGGHPLAMNAMLPALVEQSARNVMTSLRARLQSAADSISVEAAQLYATLGFTADALDERLRPWLIPLTFHERYVDSTVLGLVGQQAAPELSDAAKDDLLVALVRHGLLRHFSTTAYEMHPALTGYLHHAIKDQVEEDVFGSWAGAFVTVLAGLADQLAPLTFHKQRPFVLRHGAHFLTALREAERLGRVTEQAALHQALGAFAQNQGRWGEAETHFIKLGELMKQQKRFEMEAGAYHQLGILAEQRRDIDTAEGWFVKSLEINEKRGGARGAAANYHQLGTIAEKRRDFEAAERWYLKSLESKKGQRGANGVEATYHQLGRIAGERRDFETAERWYLKSLEVNRKQKNAHGVAKTYHQLGILAEQRRDIGEAESWYLESLKIKKEQGDARGVAITYHQLGMLAHRSRAFETAERRYLKSLRIHEEQGSARGAAITYHMLGMLALERGDLDTAERWFLKSLEIDKGQGSARNVAAAYRQLGKVAQERREFDAAERWLLKSIESEKGQGDLRDDVLAYLQLGMIAQERHDFDTAERWFLKSLEVNERQGSARGAAIAYYQLGIIALSQGRFETAGPHLILALQTMVQTNDLVNAQKCAKSFMTAYREAPPETQVLIRASWEAAGFPWPDGEDAGGDDEQ